MDKKAAMTLGILFVIGCLVNGMLSASQRFQMLITPQGDRIIFEPYSGRQWVLEHGDFEKGWKRMAEPWKAPEAK